MRKTSEVTDFPFLLKDVQYYQVNNGQIYELGNDELLIKTAYLNSIDGKSKIYATWHGKHRTDMFFVDDLYKLGLVFLFEKTEHKHDIIWRHMYPHEIGAYFTIELEFACGCTFDTADGIFRLKKELLLAKGWDMSTSYRGGLNGKYIVRIKKNSIR